MSKEEIEALVEMRTNCLNASVYDDEKRLIKANAITRALMIQERIDKVNKYIHENVEDDWGVCGTEVVWTIEEMLNGDSDE